MEFAGLSLAEAARVVAHLFGGDVTWKDAHRATIDGTRFGTFIAELDSDYVHVRADMGRFLGVESF